MQYLPEKAVPISKKKLIGLLVIAVIFILLGIWFLTISPSTMATSRKKMPIELLWGIGWVSILFFGACAVFIIKRILDKRPGLILNEYGLTDYSSVIAAGFIPWSDIIGLAEYQQSGQRTLIIRVHDPQKYINKAGLFKKMAYQANLKLCGSPLAISPNSLQVNFDELVQLLQTYRQ